MKSHALGKKPSADFEYSTYLPTEWDALPMDISGLYWGLWVAQGAGQGIYIHVKSNLDLI